MADLTLGLERLRSVLQFERSGDEAVMV